MPGYKDSMENMTNKAPDDLLKIARQFAVTGSVLSVRPFGNGNINDTFLVTLHSGEGPRFILQRLNTRVFTQPELVMKNMRIVTDHVYSRLQGVLLENDRRWTTPRVLPTREGQDCRTDTQGSFWRAISFIEAAETFDIIRSVAHAEEAGFALGMFHNLVSDMPHGALSDTLEGFHITPLYLSHYDSILSGYRHRSSPETEYCIQFIERMRSKANVIEEAKARGDLPIRTMHGDPKINNIMIDVSTQHAVCMVDLDTVKPGLVHYDIGDCLRSACNPLGEETQDWETVRFEPDLCRAIMRGYIPQAVSFLTEKDYDYLFEAVRLIAFELGLRFFTDYLEGDVYFKSGYEKQNLLRALVQFKLAESIESQEKAIRAIICGFR